LWRDLGYVVGAVLAGFLTDMLGAPTAIRIIGAITAASGIVVAVRFRVTRAGAFATGAALPERA